MQLYSNSEGIQMPWLYQRQIIDKDIVNEFIFTSLNIAIEYNSALIVSPPCHDDILE